MRTITLSFLAALIGWCTVEAASVAYISNTGSDEVWVVDLTCQNVISVIDVGSDPRGIAAAPDGSRVYVANRFGDSVSVIDTAANTVVDTIFLGALTAPTAGARLSETGVTATEPYDVAVSPDGAYLYVAMKNGGSENGDGTVVFIHLATRELFEVILDSSASPEGIVVTPDNTRIIVAGRGDLYVVDAVNRTFLGTAGNGDRELDVTPDGQWVLAENNAVATDTLTVFPNSEWLGSRGVVISPDGQRVFTTSESTSVRVFDLGFTNGHPAWHLTATITNAATNLQFEAYGIDLTVDGQLGLVSWRGSDSVQLFSPTTLQFIGPPIPMEFDERQGYEPKQLVIVDLPGGAGGMAVEVLDTPTLNWQTGLFEQRIRVRNTQCQDADAVEVLVQSLATGATVYNASGSRDGTPFILYNHSLAQDATVEMVIEYYRSDRGDIGEPNFAASGVTAEPMNLPGTRQDIIRKVSLQGEAVLVEFAAVPGQRYAIEYSHDMVEWTSANPPITAAGTRVQWIDVGPPKTASPPGSAASRYYRFVHLSNP